MKKVKKTTTTNRRTKLKLIDVVGPFTDFKSRCAHQGITDVLDQTIARSSYQLYAAFVRAGAARVKCEIKPDRYTIGQGLNPANLNLLRDELLAEGYECSAGTSNFSIFYTAGITVEEIYEGFFNLTNQIADIEGIVSRSRGQARKVFTREVAEANIFEKIAKRYRNAIDNEDQDLLDVARNLLSGDTIDHLITIGESVKRTVANSYREHIVPCILIHNHAIDLTLAGTPVTEVAQMIKENLAIVLITPAEAELIDTELGLRTCMPADWQFGDTVFARLDAGGIVRK